MILKTVSKFSFVNRGRKRSIVLLPGWATDSRIFQTLDIDFNYFLPINFSLFNFRKNLLELIKENNIKKISLFGWSMGGFAAADFVSEYSDLIDELILVSIRKKYEHQTLEQIKKSLIKNKKVFLYKFYTQCFFKKENMSWFKNNLSKDYCEKLDLESLINGLDYLENPQIDFNALKSFKKLKIIHGKQDLVAPIEEVVDIKENLPNAQFIRIKNTGHIPFLEDDLNKYL